MRLESRFPQDIVYEFCFKYCVEGMGRYHEVTDALAEGFDFIPNALE